MNQSEIKKVAPLLMSTDINAGVDADSVNMAKAFRAMFVILFGTLAGDAVLTLNSGATDGVKTTALTFKYALGSAALGSAGCDVIGDTTSAATLTLTAATYTDKMLIVEIENDKLTEGEPWLTLALSDAADSGPCTIMCLLDPRHTKDKSPSVLA